MADSEKTVGFTTLAECNKDDIKLMAEMFGKVVCSPEKMADRAIQMLLDQKGVYGGCKVDMLEHGLQTASR